MKTATRSAYFAGSRARVSKRTAGIVACLCLLIYVLLSPVVAMPLYSKLLLFYPWKYPSGYYDQARIRDISPEDVYFRSANGNRLHGWYYHKPQCSKTLIVHHGQGANVSACQFLAGMFLDCDVNVLLYDYQGFGRSEGEPSIEGLLENGLSAFDFVCEGRKVPSKNIINCGESLGTGVAAYVTEKRTCGGLILYSPYASLIDCAKQRYPFLLVYPRFMFPVRELECRTCVAGSHPPLLLVHGTLDQVISISNSDELFAMATSPKKYMRIENDYHDPTNWNYQPAFKGFINSLK